jgi:two-component system, OmpR family, sensor kinase
MWRPTTLRQRVTTWIGLSTGVSLVVFGVVAFAVAITHDEREDAAAGRPETLSETVSEVEGQVLLALLVAAPVGVACAMGGAYWLVRRALTPLDAVIAAAREITPTDMSARLPVPPAADEVRALVLTLNASFARLEGGFVALERFAGHASHELRTPLATLRNELEVALRRPRSVSEWEVVARESLEDVGKLADLTDGLLRYTRAKLSPPARWARMEVGELLGEIVAELRPGDGGPELALFVDEPAHVHGLWVTGDRDGLASALSNVLRNAVTFAGPSGRVEIRAQATGRSRVSITIDDDGPGIAPEDAELAFQPFTRPRCEREARPSIPPRQGVGLGLSITRSIVDAAGGRITASRGPLGGARIAIELPASAEEPGGPATALAS